MTKINYQYLVDNDLIIFETIVGSQAYGTNIETSDIDRKFVYILPEDCILGTKYVEQVNHTKDHTGYEVKRFLELVRTNNPNILELLNSPEECILTKKPVFDLILKHKDIFISKVCRWSFGGYAIQQIKKARGLNKKIVTPVEVTRKSPLDFCYVFHDGCTIPLTTFLNNKKINQEECGIVNLSNSRDNYVLYHNKNLPYRGVVVEESNQLRLSSVPKGEKPICYFSYNKDGYINHCKDFKSYWDWVEDRNPERYQTNSEHGKGYDSKNMMHCHRLLDMAIEILEGKGINVRRPNREELLKIRSGEKDYNELILEAENKITLMDELFEKSDLPDEINYDFIHDLLVDIRKKFYGKL